MENGFLEGVIGVVEATNFEYSKLWEAWEEKDDWKSISGGYGVTIGRIDSRPVFISLRTAIIHGHKVLFIDPTSEVVDWKLIETWLLVNLPESAMEGKRVNTTDATNFRNIFHYVEIDL